MIGERRRYGFLVLLLACATLYTGGLWNDRWYRLYRHGAEVPVDAFRDADGDPRLADRHRALLKGDMIFLSLNGKPFKSPKATG